MAHSNYMTQWNPVSHLGEGDEQVLDALPQHQPRYTGFASSLSSPKGNLPLDVRVSLESRLSDSHQERVHQLAERLRSNIDLESDEILAALRHSPLTAPHAEARTTELLSDVMAADQQATARCFSDQMAQKDSELAGLQQQLDNTKQQLYAAQSQQHTSQGKAGHVAAERAHLQAQVDSLKAEVERHRKAAADAHAARLESDKALASAHAKMSASQLSVQSKLDELEHSRDFHKALAERREREVQSLEKALQKQVADTSRRNASWGHKELALSADHGRTREQLAAANVEVEACRSQVEVSQAKLQRLERSNAHLRKQRAQMMADLQEVENVLGESEQERKDIRHKYIALGEKLELVLHQEERVKEGAERDTQAAKMAVKEAVSDLEMVSSERAELASRLNEQLALLEEEQHSKRKLRKKLTKRVEEAEREVAQLQQKLEDKAIRLEKASKEFNGLAQRTEQQATAFEHKIEQLQSQCCQLEKELARKQGDADVFRHEAENKMAERMRVALREQQLEYESQVREMESKLKQYGISEMTTNPQDFISRKDHARICDSRVSAREADLQSEFARRLEKAEHESRWKLDQQVDSLSDASKTHLRQLQDTHAAEQKKLSTEMEEVRAQMKKTQLRAEEVQGTFETHNGEYLRMKAHYEELRAERDVAEQQLSETARQLSRAEKQLKESQEALSNSAHEVERLAQRVQDLASEKERAQQLEADLKKSKALHDTSMKETVTGHEQALEEALASNQKALKEARVAHEQAVQALNAEIATHQETIRAQTTKTNRLQQQLSEAQQLSTQLDASLSATKAELRTSRDRVASLEEASKKLSEEVEAGVQLSVQVVNLKSELDSAQRRQEEQQLALRSKLNKFGLQALAQVAELRQQQTLLKTHIQGEVALASSECTHQLESAQYTWRQKALMMEGQAQSESITVAKLQAHSSQLTSELEALQQQLFQQKQEATALTAHSNTLQADLDSSKSRLQGEAERAAFHQQQLEAERKLRTLRSEEGDSAQAQLQKAQQQQQALQETLALAEKQRQAVEARLQLHVQQELGMMALLAEDFSLSSELQQKLSAEGEAHATALQELRNQMHSQIQQAAVTSILTPIQTSLTDAQSASTSESAESAEVPASNESQGGAGAGRSTALLGSAVLARVDELVQKCAGSKASVKEMRTRHAAALEKVRAEGRSAAESARGDVVEPLKEEVEHMRQQLEEAQAMYEAQLTQEVKRADTLSAELERQQDDSSRGIKGNKRGTGDILAGRTQSQGGADPLIPASRPAGGASTAGSELDLLRKKLKDLEGSEAAGQGSSGLGMSSKAGSSARRTAALSPVTSQTVPGWMLDKV
ncbi:hypothetical protein ABBQ38_013608 [Trebouxia sp. C0009 RCD-2024]